MTMSTLLIANRAIRVCFEFSYFHFSWMIFESIWQFHAQINKTRLGNTRTQNAFNFGGNKIGVASSKLYSFNSDSDSNRKIQSHWNWANRHSNLTLSVSQTHFTVEFATIFSHICIPLVFSFIYFRDLHNKNSIDDFNLITHTHAHTQKNTERALCNL